MGEIKQINIKNRTYYFYNDIIDLKDFFTKLLKIDKKSLKNLTIKKNDDHESSYSVNLLYLHIYLLVMQVDISKKKLEVNI